MRPSGPTIRTRDGSDGGFSLLEVLVSVVLIATVVVAVLTALGSTVRGGDLARDRTAQAAWLQSSADALQRLTWVGCTGTSGTSVASSYQMSLRAAGGPTPPSGWSSSQLSVTSVRSWNGSGFVASCVPTTRLQQVTLRAQDPSGRTVTTLVVGKALYDAS